jgi:endonuclease YncB( thermonuclease family)
LDSIGTQAKASRVARANVCSESTSIKEGDTVTRFGPYPAQVVAVHDGDTCTLDIDLGFDHIIKGQDFKGNTRLSCRVYGINAPELNTAAGKGSLEYALTLLPIGSLVTIFSHGWDKYGGRFDGTIQLEDGRDYGEVMVQAGQAVLI